MELLIEKLQINENYSRTEMELLALQLRNDYEDAFRNPTRGKGNIDLFIICLTLGHYTGGGKPQYEAGYIRSFVTLLNLLKLNPFLHPHEREYNEFNFEFRRSNNMYTG